MLLDEAMLAVTSDELSPLVTGVIYCGVIAACQQSYALDRAREWTAALSRWCEGQPQLVAFAGACLIHRSEILRARGRVARGPRRGTKGFAPTVRNEGRRSGQRVLPKRRAPPPAWRATKKPNRRTPSPVNAAASLSRGFRCCAWHRVASISAAAATRRVLSATSEPLKRARFLPAHVEIMLAASELDEARRAADELRAIAEGLGMETLGAMAEHAKGAVALAEGDARGAIEPLRSAQEVWQRVGAPYLGARMRVVVARAFRELGDERRRGARARRGEEDLPRARCRP